MDKGKQKRNTNVEEDEDNSSNGSTAASPHTRQPPRKVKSKVKKSDAAIKEALKLGIKNFIRGPDDEKLAKAIDRINQGKDLVRGLLFVIAQKIPEARKVVLSV